MTPESKKWKELSSNITAAHRALVSAMREIRECSPRTQAEIARDAHQAATTLSNHLNGGRVPEETLLRDFYEVIEKDAAGGEALPHTLDALLELRVHAQKRHCECCSVGYPPVHDLTGPKPCGLSHPAELAGTAGATPSPSGPAARIFSAAGTDEGAGPPSGGGPAPCTGRRAHVD